MEATEISNSEWFNWLNILLQITSGLALIVAFTKFGKSQFKKAIKALIKTKQNNSIKFTAIMIFLIILMIVLPVIMIIYSYLYLKGWLFWFLLSISIYLIICFVLTFFILIGFMDILYGEDS